MSNGPKLAGVNKSFLIFLSFVFGGELNEWVKCVGVSKNHRVKEKGHERQKVKERGKESGKKKKEEWENKEVKDLKKKKMKGKKSKHPWSVVCIDLDWRIFVSCYVNVIFYFIFKWTIKMIFH